MTCPSRSHYLGLPCDRPEGHNGQHNATAADGERVFWFDHRGELFEAISAELFGDSTSTPLSDEEEA